MDPRRRRTMDALLAAAEEVHGPRVHRGPVGARAALRRGGAVPAVYLDHPEYFRLLAFPAEPGRYAAGHELAERSAVAVQEQNNRMVDAIRRGVAAGELRPVDADDAATVLWAAWNGVISLGWRPDGLRRSDDELRRARHRHRRGDQGPRGLISSPCAGGRAGA